MDLPILVPILVAAVTGAFGAVYKLIERKTETVKVQVGKAGVEVETVLKAMEGVERQANQLRIDLDRKQVECDRITAQKDELEKDLIEEKSINVALTRELDKRKGRA